MICKNYIVTGEDVNDVMVMENTAYISYTLRILYHFLFANGFSREKLNALHLGLQEKNPVLSCYQNLMFTEPFLVVIEHYCVNDKISIKSSFFNSKNECCAEAAIEVEWFNQIRREVIGVPKQILKHFNPNTRAQAKNHD